MPNQLEFESSSIVRRFISLTQVKSGPFNLNPSTAADFSVSVFHSCTITFLAPPATVSDGWILFTYSLETVFLSSFQTVLSVKHKLKALLFRVLIYGALREFI